MRKVCEGLSALRVKKINLPGKYHDGDGLYLQVSTSNNKSWIFRFKHNQKTREMGLGSFRVISLSEARKKVLQYRKLLIDGVDPIEYRASKKRKDRVELANKVTFNKCSRDYIESHRSGWSNIKHSFQWNNTLKAYASPMLGDLSIQEIDTSHIMKVLEPIWRTKTETASRIRSRLERILDWATVMGYRSGENPARWRGHLDKLLPKRSKVQPVQHLKAIPIKQMGTVLNDIRARNGISARALEFLILTASRTGEVLNATWDEIDISQETWTIPSHRMKSRKEHRIPLSRAALEILRPLKEFSASNYVFPNNKLTQPLSSMALLVILRKMGLTETVHGFRSTFRDWSSEQTNFSRETCEAALAHTISDKVEAAYRRGDLFLKRKRLMEEWAKFCSKKGFEKSLVTNIREARSIRNGLEI